MPQAHILACSFSSWYPTFRPYTPKARIITLPTSFTSYLRSDGIILPPSRPGTPRAAPTSTSDDEGFFSSSNLSTASLSSTDSEPDNDPSLSWPETHALIKSTVSELGGAVVPKLNWSAPKDATWIGATNSLECRSANDVYLLLKSSDFVTHDLEHAFDDCVDWSGTPDQLDAEVGYVLVLRKFFRLNPSLEFRVFVRDGTVLGVTQRDLNFYDFLFDLRPKFKTLILEFWEQRVKGRFGERSYAFDVYIPPPHDRVWLVDFNPWAMRTDPCLFSWAELLSMPAPHEVEGEVVRLRFATDGEGASTPIADGDSEDEDSEDEPEMTVAGMADTPGPEMRLVTRDDPEAYMFNSTRYSAHKLPRDVVDASQAGAGGMREFADRWKEMLERRGPVESDADDDDDD
ncbi:hypothetical protein ANO11243_040470 [Dothideomycetidae sp. 11243]|nr:hypothetical protein ANO11243_040470 [fungal sp. No.11243]